MPPWSSTTPEQRFWSKVMKTDTCWVWTAAKARGYGIFGVRRVMKLAHRVAYEWEVGPIPEGMTLDHLCRNKLCVNPDHLEPVTGLENHMRGISASGRLYRAGICGRGHTLTGENLYIAPNGRRRCRVCDRERRRRRV